MTMLCPDHLGDAGHLGKWILTLQVDNSMNKRRNKGAKNCVGVDVLVYIMPM